MHGKGGQAAPPPWQPDPQSAKGAALEATSGADAQMPVAADLVLTRLEPTRPGPRRLVHSLAHQRPLRFAGRVLNVGTEVAWATVKDVLSRRRPNGTILRSEAGHAPPATDWRRLALYTHYSASGHVSSMVLAQLAEYRALGFDVVFVTNAAQVDAADWQAVAEHAMWMIHRRNLGFDFGAWGDAAAFLLRDHAPPEELLLVNDSVLGPLRPMEPILAQARSAGDGVVGLTESRQGGIHLQSYFLLLLGQAATADALRFLAQLPLSASKWLMVQRGEIGFTRYLLRRGHRVSALFGYARALDSIIACPAERRYLATMMPQAAAAAEPDTPERIRKTLLRWPLNPTHHLWRGLPICLGFPFLKTQLVLHNPGRLLGVQDWPVLFEPGAPCSAAQVRDHLETLGRPRRG